MASISTVLESKIMTEQVLYIAMSYFIWLKMFAVLGSSLNGHSIKPHERLLCFLWTSGGNATFMSQEWSHNMSYGSVVESNSITREILYEHMVLSKRYLHLPTRQQSLHEAELFARKYGPRRNQQVAIRPVYNFPQILVFMCDGTHIESRCIASIYLRV